MKWQWFLGGQIMFWVATILLVLFIFIYATTYMIDPMTSMYMKIQNTDTTSIKELSNNYLKSLGITVSKPISYRFVQYQHEDHFNTNSNSETVLLGTFHEWNGTYYIDISVSLYKMPRLYETVKHEIRHMIVQELKNEKIINLSKYSEEIAQEKNKIYNDLFDYGVQLLKEKQNPTDISVNKSDYIDKK